ncbi:Uncharacterized membrane protein [Gillisia sp. Hel1_33_143]|uniref:DUF1622 domain-containing protein n=1 Tax=unclassified Gillisia TaxID=2615025 RepID=UPI000551F4A4|nr:MULTISPECIES: DUF1622 domain-containing protein [unclassified Gillisia]SDS37932.1 Uncharacterized membrane protein [Gillisia sp. Hel1_33_143]
MDKDLLYFIEIMANVIEVTGILTIIIGAAIALVRYAFKLQAANRSYKILRQELGKAILLGLEFLVAGDIIGTVVIDPTIQQVLSLGLIVLIRTFLSLSLQVELEGKFPWQKTD